MMKIKKSTGVAWALIVYITLTAIYLLPRNTEITETEKYLTLAASYLFVLPLWSVLRKKEKRQQRRREEEQQNNSKNKHV